MSDRYISVKFLEEMMRRHKPLSGSDSTKERYAFMEWLGIYNAIKDAPTITISECGADMRGADDEF